MKGGKRTGLQSMGKTVQLRPFNFAFVQDAWVAVAIGGELLAIVLKLLDVFVNEELGNSMSNK